MARLNACCPFEASPRDSADADAPKTVQRQFTPVTTIEQEAGLPLFIIGPILGIGSGDYVLPAGVALIPGILANPSLGPPPSSDVLRAVQVLEVGALIDAYSLIIMVGAIEHELQRRHPRLHIEHFPSYAPELNPTKASGH